DQISLRECDALAGRSPDQPAGAKRHDHREDRPRAIRVARLAQLDKTSRILLPAIFPRPRG
ncbi:hypothetical protein, partial [Candidatus Mycobacterium methanotrophicum]|uniref:hypothetical protein n=1 Tax=Candidatus Mycobacterium methanotrophicum TaxID=2943498 RepID=UPI001C5A10C5